MADHRAPAAPLAAFAITVNPADNVAVAKTAVEPGLSLACPTAARSPSPAPSRQGTGSRSVPIPAGDFVRQYGQPIGTSRGIGEGDPITPAEHEQRRAGRARPARRSSDAPAALSCPSPSVPPCMGYRRADGRVGTRNFVLIVPTSMCASHESQQIATIAEFTLYNRERFRTSTASSPSRTTRAAAARMARTSR